MIISLQESLYYCFHEKFIVVGELGINTEAFYPGKGRLCYVQNYKILSFHKPCSINSSLVSTFIVFRDCAS